MASAVRKSAAIDAKRPKSRQSCTDGIGGLYASPVATYPPIGDRERDAAVARIAARHERYDDSRWSEAGTEARDVLNYLSRRRAELPFALTAHDSWDELVLSAWVHWDERRRERELLHSALRRGLSLAEVGRYLGIASRQGTRDYLDRLDALLADLHRARSRPRTPVTGDGASDPLAVWAGTTREQRGADVHASRAQRAAGRQRPTRMGWLEVHRGRLSAVVADLFAQLARLGIDPRVFDEAVADLDEDDVDDVLAEPGLSDYLVWLEQDHRAEVYTPGTIASLGLVLGELRDHPVVAVQAANHGIRRVMGEADQLRADFAALTSGGPPGQVVSERR